MHDNDIISYNVNLIKKNISVKTYNNEQKNIKQFIFQKFNTFF